MNLSKFARIGALTLAVLHIVVFISGCEVVTEFTNDPPKITYFTVPVEVEYGETVAFRVGAYDAQDDPLTYSWEVSAGRLTTPAEPEVEWTAPELPPGEVVRVDVSVQDSGEEETSKTGSITVFSKTYRLIREGADPGTADSEPINTNGSPVEITDETFGTEVLPAKLPVVVEFRADWSPFCKQMNPIVEAVAVGSRDTFIVGRLDIDKNPGTPRAYKVDDIPTYLVFRDGTEVARFEGPMPKPVFLQKILDALK